jgi:hypothetical protein
VITIKPACPGIPVQVSSIETPLIRRASWTGRMLARNATRKGVEARHVNVDENEAGRQRPP